jgi:hypothetical protein
MFVIVIERAAHAVELNINKSYKSHSQITSTDFSRLIRAGNFGVTIIAVFYLRCVYLWENKALMFVCSEYK